ncbi:nitroreductase family protein [Cohnella sp. CFH 77786]|uniref:nitroreductase family protein n=1 Tax=Cohnella sp. CFH 77786 TaxID=2662265 RepID=UPI001C610B3A|nr:nitroreductase family protein [Cohnella sp. CFH 77786]MBW5447115.1 nitroreductase family protein [Cohnella sp. CFH 77786]
MSTTATQEQAFLEVIQSRRSVRQYDPHTVISREELKEMLTLAAKAPSSANMQLWRFLVIDSPELKEKLLPIANSQQQVVEASAIIAILGDVEGYRKADRVFGQAIEAGYMPEDVANSFKERYVSLYSSLPSDRIREVAVIDASLAAMQLMLVARAKGYDTVPMGGFDREKFKEAFNLGERYVPVMLLPIGKAAKPGHPTARLPIEDVTFWNEVK